MCPVWNIEMTDTQDPAPLYSISELSQQLGLTPRAIRFYESKDLLAPQRVGATRVYTHGDRARLQIIQRGKRMGFSLTEIKEYLDLRDADPAHHKQLRRLLSGVRERIARLEQQRTDLEITLEELREVERLTLEAMAQAASDSTGSEGSSNRQNDPTSDGGSPTS